MTREPERRTFSRDAILADALASLEEARMTRETMRDLADIKAAQRLLRRVHRRETLNAINGLIIAGRTDPERGVTAERVHPRSDRWRITSGCTHPTGLS